MVVSKVVKLENYKQVNKRKLKQMQYTCKEGTKNAVVQNKENTVSCRGPAGQTWQHPYVWDQLHQSTHQLRPGDNFSVVEIESSKTDRCFRTPHNTQGYARNLPEHIAWPAISKHDHSNKRYDGATDFTNDHLPQNGAIIFDHSLTESTGSPQPVEESSHGSGQPASVNKSANAAPIRDVDVSAMLRQIRRALGVREPCRADREARRQNSEAEVQLADQAGAEKEQPPVGSFGNYAKEAALRITSAATTSVQSSPVSSLAPASHSGVRPSDIVPAKPKHTAVKLTQGTPQHCEKSSVVASDTNGALDSHISLSRCSGTTASSESNVNISHRVRIAHKPGKVQEGKEAVFKPTLNTSLNSSGAKSKLGRWEKCEDVRRKKQERVKWIPRFGIEFANPDQGTSTQAEDLPLSEGFHWESLPHSTSGEHWTGLPPQPQETTRNESHTETRSDSQMQEPSEKPGAAQEACSRQTVRAVSVKVEANLEDENGDLRDHSSARKRKHNVVTVSKIQQYLAC